VSPAQLADVESQPHWTSWPPAESSFQKWSISSCVSQFATNEIASEPFGRPAACAASPS
jgi:hypothetical protein